MLWVGIGWVIDREDEWVGGWVGGWVYLDAAELSSLPVIDAVASPSRLERVGGVAEGL